MSDLSFNILNIKVQNQRLLAITPYPNRALMKSYLKLINRDTPGNRGDITPLFADFQALNQLVDDLVSQMADVEADYVACIDALGFILGTSIAHRLELGVIPVRKGGKLPVEADSIEFQDYTKESKRLELSKTAFPENSRILLVDEWSETGAQIQAAASLIERQQGIIVGIATINMDDYQITSEIRKKYPVFTVWEAEHQDSSED